MNAWRKRSWILHLTECRVSFAVHTRSLSRSYFCWGVARVSLRNRKFIQKFRNYKSARMFRESEITRRPPLLRVSSVWNAREWRGTEILERRVTGRAGRRLYRYQLQITVLKIRYRNDTAVCKTVAAIKSRCASDGHVDLSAPCLSDSAILSRSIKRTQTAAAIKANARSPRSFFPPRRRGDVTSDSRVCFKNNVDKSRCSFYRKWDTSCQRLRRPYFLFFFFSPLPLSILRYFIRFLESALRRQVLS